MTKKATKQAAKKGTARRPVTKDQFLREWVKDLESGRYTQCLGRLYNPDTKGHCCLGVACRTGKRLGIRGAAADVDRMSHGLAEMPGGWFRDLIGAYNPDLIVDDDKGRPGFTVLRSAGLLNDTNRRSFRHIAAAIRRTFPSAFKGTRAQRATRKGEAR